MVAPNHLEAYKWAAIASAQGHAPARFLVKEYELFMMPKEIADGKSAAKTYLSEQKKKD